MRVVIEPQIPAHDPTLYKAAHVAEGVEGFDAVDEAAMKAYDEQGFILIRGGFTAEEVAAARQELADMARSDDPRCAAVYYEGELRRHLAEAAGGVRDAATPSAGPDGGGGAATGTQGAASGGGAAATKDDADNLAPGDSPTVSKLALGRTLDALPDVDREVRASLVRKLAGFTKEHPPLAALAKKPELKELVKRIVGPRLRLFQTMAMIKPPRGREKPWHQDHAYFNLPIETKIVGIWVALDKVTAENGAMVVLAGAHKEGPRVHFMRRDWQICDTDITGVGATVLPMEPGDVMIFDGKLPHGTPTNNTDMQRWAVQIHYISRDVQETPEEERLAVFGSEGKGVTC